VQVIGRKIKLIVGESEVLKQHLTMILTKERMRIVERVAPHLEKPEDEVSRLFEYLLKGILE
jgi:hypothetical protein